MKKEGGYTIVEAGLAIAMSASLILLTVGLTSMVGRQRFRTTMTTAQSFIQAQYNEVRSGINSRYDDAAASTNILGCNRSGSTGVTATSSNCYTIGRAVSFALDGTIKSSYVVAKASSPSWPNTEKTALENLRSGVVLYAITSENSDAGLNPTTKLIGNGSEIRGAWHISGNDARALGSSSVVAILRSPVDGSLVVVANAKLKNPTDSSVRAQQLDISSGDIYANMASSDRLALAIVNGGLGFYGGLICVAGGDSSAGISINYNVSLPNWGNVLAPENKNAIIEGCKNQG